MTAADRDLIGDLRAYSRKFTGVEPAFFSQWNQKDRGFPFPLRSEKGVRALLYFSSLFQGIREKHLSNILGRLYAAFSDHFFDLHKVPFAVLQKEVEKIRAPYQWALAPKVPGILRSVCDFLLSHPSLLDWVGQLENSEVLVDELSTKIFFMGKSSSIRFKARYFIWLLLNGFPEFEKAVWKSNSVVPPSAGAQRVMHFIGPLKGTGSAAMAGSEKVEFYNQFYRRIFPEASWRLYLPLAVFQSRVSHKEYECQKQIGGCPRCPLDRWCNG